MSAHWDGVARKAGYNPKKFIDAKEGEGLRAVVGLKHMKSAVIGDGTQCSGARCLNDNPEVEWCYVGASRAFVVFTDGRHRRFMVNGIPAAQDRTMNVAGEELILRPPSRTERLAFQRKRLKAYNATTGNRKGATDGTRSRHRTLAAQLRNTS